MKTIHVDDDLYDYIASQTRHIGESASDILRRMLDFPAKGLPAGSVAGTTPKRNNALSEKKSSAKALAQCIISPAYQNQKKVIGRFMSLLSILYQLDALAFTQAVATIHGRTRRYFANEQQTLLESGTHTRPYQVPDTPFWVITNTNTNRKRMMLRHIMQHMQLPRPLIDSVCNTL